MRPGDRWRGSGHGGVLRTASGRVIEFTGCADQRDVQKFKGRAHDLKFWDELVDFPESAYLFVNGWNRTTVPGQRCRIVGATNPPTTAEGDWVTRRWAPWIDSTCGKLSAPGELRWYTTIDGQEVEFPDGSPVTHGRHTYSPRSRTFIPGEMLDLLKRTGYENQLATLPEPLRSILLLGDFGAARQDDRWQLIPTNWVVKAQQRWPARMLALGTLTALGVDVAMGGDAKTVVAPRHGATINTLRKRKGSETPDGQSVVKEILDAGGGKDDGVKTNIDVIGIGKSAYDVARMMGLKNVFPIVVSEATTWKDPKVSALRFANLRSAMMWKVRTLLDPEGGPEETRLALPPDRELMADLTAPRYEMRVQGIMVESKEKIRERIGRSTDCFVAGTPVLTEYGDRPIETINVGDLVWTRRGLFPVVDAGVTHDISPTVTVTFSDGRSFTASPNHPIHVPGIGFIPIDAVVLGDRVLVCEHQPSVTRLFSRESCTSDFLTVGRYPGAGTTTSTPRAEPCTRRFGRMLTGQSQRECTSTTRTRTRLTTPWTICSFLPTLNTASCTGTSRLLRKLISREFDPSPPSGTAVQRDWRFTLNSESFPGKSESLCPESASSVGKSGPARWIATRTDFVQEDVRKNGTTETRRISPSKFANCARKSSYRRHQRLRTFAPSPVLSKDVFVTSVQANSSQRVFNLAVDECHEFFANGVLVHNCGDSVGLAVWDKGVGYTMV